MLGSRVMFTGPYGVRENGAWQEWLLARPEDLAFVPEKGALSIARRRKR
jgi:NADPH:quinone reductase